MKKITEEKLTKLFNYFQNGNYEYVIRESKTLLKKFPYNLALYNLLGLSFQQINNFKDAKGSYLKALQLNSKNVSVLNNLGSLCRVLEEYENSEKYLIKALSLQPKYVHALSNYGNLKKELNDFDGAIELYKEAIKLNDNNFVTHHNLALAYQGIGKFDLAKKHAFNVLRINPNYYLTHKIISSSTKYSIENEHFKIMLKKLNEEKLDPKHKITLDFSISKAFEDMDNYEKSSFHIRNANILKRKHIKYDIKNEIKLFNEIKKIFSKTNLNNQNKKDLSKIKIVFICGMPRSGTTLVEQIIASHKEVYGAGELNYLSKVIEKNFYNNNIVKENLILEKINESNNNIYKEYINYLKVHKFSQNVVTDKAPLNFRWIGFIKVFFPNSKIIHCNRNAKDNCLSLYKNQFESDKLNWCYDEKELTTYYNLYSELMNFWKEKVPSFIYDAKYEDIVQNQEKETRKMLEFCNLDWDENCLNFFKNSKTPIKTASIAQARKPIYKTSLKLHKKYNKYFEDFFSYIND